MRWVALVSCVVFAVLSSVRGQVDENRRESSTEGAGLKALGLQATRAFARRDWQEASRLYHAILETDPENPLILANVGAVEYQLKDFEACCHYLERALVLQDDLSASREMLGMAYFQRDRPMLALACLARAVADQPESPRVHNQLAVVLQSLEWYDGAERALRKAIQLDPEYRDAHYNLALVYTARTPPSVGLAGRHYSRALSLGLSPDAALEKRLRQEKRPDSDDPSGD